MKAVEYQLDSNTANLAKITLDARYPERGYALNTQSEMIVYVLEGEVLLHQEGKEQRLEKGEAVVVRTHRQYFWQPNLSATLLIFSTPPWTPEQQKIV